MGTGHTRTAETDTKSGVVLGREIYNRKTGVILVGDAIGASKEGKVTDISNCKNFMKTKIMKNCMAFKRLSPKGGRVF